MSWFMARKPSGLSASVHGAGEIASTTAIYLRRQSHRKQARLGPACNSVVAVPFGPQETVSIAETLAASRPQCPV